MSIEPHAITIDSADAARAAEFWSAALEQPVDPEPSVEFASIGMSVTGDGQRRWMFTQVPEAKQVKNRVHVDFGTTDLEGEVQRLVGLGAARRADHDESGSRWTTLTDPEGNEFDVVELTEP
jgi:predicted enzyme related to lactoylglutathione lyase